jgi:hypothetical protein
MSLPGPFRRHPPERRPVVLANSLCVERPTHNVSVGIDIRRRGAIGSLMRVATRPEIGPPQGEPR